MAEHYESSPSHWRLKPIQRDTRQARAKKRGLTIALGVVLLAALGALVSLIFRYDRYPRPQFLPLVLHEYESNLPLRAWARQDAVTLRDLHWARKPDTLTSQKRTLLEDELKRHDKVSPSAPLLVYLSAYVIADDQGEPCLLAVDERPDDPKGRLALAEVFRLIAALPARHKLVLLDVMQPLLLPEEGLLRSDAASLVWPTVAKAVQDQPGLQVLCACSPGQVSLTSDELGHSVFAYFLARGLSGQADGFLPGSRNNRVSSRELVAYVSRHVDAWALQNLGERQTPRLLGDEEDFALTDVEPAAEHEPGLPAEYPGWLLAGWKRQDQWWDQGVHRRWPRLFADLGAAVLHAESRWRGGHEDRGSGELASQLERLERQKSRLPAPEQASPLSLAQALAREPDQARLADEESAATLRQLAARRDLLARDAKPEESRLKALAGEVEAFTKKFKGKPVALAWLACEVPCGHPLGPEGFALLADLLDPADAPQLDEVAFLRRMARRGKERPADWSQAVAQAAMQLSREAARANSASEEARRWIDLHLARAAQARKEAEMLLFAAEGAWDQAAGPAVRAALHQYRQLNRDRGIIEEACRSRDEGLALLPGYAAALEIDDRPAAAWLRACATTRELRQALDSPLRRDVPERIARIDLLEERSETLQKAPNSLQSLRQPLTPTGFRALMQQRKADGLADARTYQALLATPWPRADQRQKLWAEYRAQARRQHESALEAFEATRPRLPELTAWDEKKGRAKLTERDLARARRSLMLLRLVSRQDTAALTRALDEVSADREDKKRWAALAAAVTQAWAKARTEEGP